MLVSMIRFETYNLANIGKDTKAMVNNSGPRYKRSDLERRANRDIVWCVVILLIMCTVGAVVSTLWMNSFVDPYNIVYLIFSKRTPTSYDIMYEGFINFWLHVIVLQVRQR